MIALASDHAGFSYKEKIKTVLNELQLPFTDFGTDSNESVDYPDYGHAAALAVSKGECNKGILVCGTGIGMSIVANKHTGVRAAACETIEAAETVAKTQRCQRRLYWRTIDNMGRGTGNRKNFSHYRF